MRSKKIFSVFIVCMMAVVIFSLSGCSFDSFSVSSKRIF